MKACGRLAVSSTARKRTWTRIGRNLPKNDPREAASIILRLSEPLAAIVSNAQAGQRIGGAAGVDDELLELLSDITQDGKRAGELIERLEALLEKG